MKNLPARRVANFIMCCVCVVLLSLTAVFAQSNNCEYLKPDTSMLTRLSDAIAANPNDATAYFERGIAYMTALRNSEALVDFKKAIDLDPKLAMAYYFRGHIYLERSNYKRSIEEHSKAINLNPNLASAYYERARGYMFTANIDAALKDFNWAIELCDSYYSAYHDRGVLYSAINKREDGTRDFEKSVELLTRRIEAPENALCPATYYADRAWSLYALDKKADAENDLNTAKVIDPRLSVVHSYIGRIYIERYEFRYAVDELTIAISLRPEYADFYSYRAKAFDGLGKEEKAKADRDKFKELSTKTEPIPAKKQN